MKRQKNFKKKKTPLQTPLQREDETRGRTKSSRERRTFEVQRNRSGGNTVCTLLYQEEISNGFSLLATAFLHISSLQEFAAKLKEILSVNWELGDVLSHSELIHMMAVGLTPNLHFAAVISYAFYSLWNLVLGFLVAKPSIPRWWIWFYYICPVAWTMQGVITSQLGDVETIIKQPRFKGSVKVYLDVNLGYGYVNLLRLLVGLLG
ncbi:hypothetical protein QYF36_019571 [Acer negundo]|nr:hypothetical protein QYF36_019571 [Acer negundo]